MLNAEMNERSRVGGGAGMPTGNLMRRYWQPVAGETESLTTALAAP